MKITFKGKLKTEELKKIELPENAVKFREPNNISHMNIIASIIAAIVWIILFGLTKLKVDNTQMYLANYTLVGWIVSFFIIIPHELVHAMCFPKNAEVDLYTMPMGMCVTSYHPISKNRFILMSLAPNILFGLIPYIVWFFIPSSGFAEALKTASILSIVMGSGDYINVFNAITQMPKGSYQIPSEFNSYWYIPE